MAGFSGHPQPDYSDLLSALPPRYGPISR